MEILKAVPILGTEGTALIMISNVSVFVHPARFGSVSYTILKIPDVKSLGLNVASGNTIEEVKSWLNNS